MEKNEKKTPTVQILSADSSFSAPYFDISASCDISHEFTLADYFPEIRRVISVSAKALPEGKFISGNTVDCDGVVAFTVTYLGEDSTVASAPFSVEYSQSIDFPDLPEEARGNPCTCDTVVESSQCRVTDPRRISLKAHLRTRIFADMQIGGEEKCVDEKGAPITGTELLSVERKCENHKSVRLMSGEKSSSVSASAHTKDIARAISADGAVNIIDARAHDGRIAVRAEVMVFILCQKNDGLYTTVREKEAFEEEIDVIGAKSGDSARACGRVVSVTVSPTSEGLSFDVEYDLEAQAMGSEDASLCADAYSTAYESTPQMCEREIYAPMKCAVLHLTATGETKRKSELAPGEYMTGMCASASCEKVEITDGRMSVSGNIAYQACIAQNGEVYPEEGKIPFTASCEISAQSAENPVWRADVQVVDISGRCDSSSIHTSAELSISVLALDKRRIRHVERIVLDRSKIREKAGGIRIYFPDDGEKVWDIGKKYSSCLRTLEKLNGWKEGCDSVDKSPVIVG